MEEMTRKRKEEEKKEMEEKVIRILTGEKLSAVKVMLEKDHAIDCIFLLMLGRGQWKHAKEFVKKLKLTLPDGTFRARMLEIAYNELATPENLDVKKKRWLITEFGKYLGMLLLEFFDKVGNMEAV